MPSMSRRIATALPSLAAALSVVGVLAASGPARGNDSSAGLSVGGLVLLQDDRIAMQREDLLLTPGGVQVDYRFRNLTDKPVETLVAFPLPPVGAPDDRFDGPPLGADPAGRYLDFVTEVDGRAVPMQVEHRARLAGIDVTDRLTAAGLPLAPYLPSTVAAIAALPDAARAALRHDLLIDAGGRPRWVLHSLFWWRQTFPPHAETRIRHRYRPLTGGSVGLLVGLWEPGQEPGPDAAAWVEADRRAYCVEPGVEAAMRAQARGDTGLPTHQFAAETLGYILTTGANWAGPIRDFHLRVQAARPEDFAFLCLDGATRVSQDVIEAHLTDFTPTRDLEVLFGEAVGANMPRP